jgi:transposase
LKMTNDQLTEMLNDEKNLVRDQSWEVQIDHFQLNCTSRIMKRACSRRQPKAGRYRMTIVKPISLKNRQLRVEYDHRHVTETMDSFWQYVHFTNETHLNPNEIFAKRVLREQSTRYEAANMQVMPQMKEIKLHFEASISWHHKSPLIFYNDEHDSSLVIIEKLFKPRRSRYQTKKTYQQRVLEWEASLSHDPKIKPKSNSMTQTYYTKRLLSVYVELIHEARVFHDRRDILQEDNDNNHDTRSKDNVVVRFKAANWIETLYHPPQSPDLNPSKTAWNMLKQRVKRRQLRTLAKLKQVMLDEWDKIIMNEIRSRISEMPRRCKILTENGGAAIKGKW